MGIGEDEVQVANLNSDVVPNEVNPDNETPQPRQQESSL